jgi:hypothetical protein
VRVSIDNLAFDRRDTDERSIPQLRHLCIIAASGRMEHLNGDWLAGNFAPEHRAEVAEMFGAAFGQERSTSRELLHYVEHCAKERMVGAAGKSERVLFFSDFLGALSHDRMGARGYAEGVVCKAWAQLDPDARQRYTERLIWRAENSEGVMDELAFTLVSYYVEKGGANE